MNEDTDNKTDAQALPISDVAEDFDTWSKTERVRAIIRHSVAGKVKRRSLMELAFAEGARVGYRLGAIVADGMTNRLAVTLDALDALDDPDDESRGARALRRITATLRGDGLSDGEADALSRVFGDPTGGGR